VTDDSAEAPDRPPAASTVPRRWRDFAALLPIVGMFLLMPPVIGLFVSDARPFGVPGIVVYVFGIWAALIAAATLASRSLCASGRPGTRPDGAPEP
jgi:hypothetical protein